MPRAPARTLTLFALVVVTTLSACETIVPRRAERRLHDVRAKRTPSVKPLPRAIPAFVNSETRQLPAIATPPGRTHPTTTEEGFPRRRSTEPEWTIVPARPEPESHSPAVELAVVDADPSLASRSDLDPEAGDTVKGDTAPSSPLVRASDVRKLRDEEQEAAGTRQNPNDHRGLEERDKTDDLDTLDGGDSLDDRDAPAWIWLDSKTESGEVAFLRRSIDVRGIVAARLWTSCDASMRVWFGGREVLRHDEPAVPVFRDLTPWLDRFAEGGQQVLAIEARAGDDDRAGVVVQLELDSGWKDGSRIVSDTSWRASEEAAKGWASADFDDRDWKPAVRVARLGRHPWPQVTPDALRKLAALQPAAATPADQIETLEGFEVERVWSVPRETHGSWVALTVDPLGRLIASDQYGSLWRVTLDASGRGGPLDVERIDVDLGEANGLLWAFDSLYVVVNRTREHASGLYRVRDTDDDDRLDEVRLLRVLDGNAEHGPHAVVLDADERSLLVVCGNGTDLPALDRSRVPRPWDEDRLLPRPHGRGFMRGRRAPGGFILRTDPDGRRWELIASGLRNAYDAAVHRTGELFAQDSDMEHDQQTPWYRPARLCHVTSGAEFGWRSGGGKWPARYPDSLPGVLDLGLGSPTGLCFGYGSGFPEPWSEALFACDWTSGTLRALWLDSAGSTFTARPQTILTGHPLPMTDIVVHAQHRALYFITGGRRIQSGLYRLRMSDAGTPAADVEHSKSDSAPALSNAARLRRRLEALHLPTKSGVHEQAAPPPKIDLAWSCLDHPDRHVRSAARIALEHRPLAELRDRALRNDESRTALSRLTALLALCRRYERLDRGSETSIDSPLPDWNGLRGGGSAESSGDFEQDAAEPTGADERRETRSRVLAIWRQVDAEETLDTDVRALGLRVLSLLFLRVGQPTPREREHLLARLEARFPTGDGGLDADLSELLTYLQSRRTTTATVELLENSRTLEAGIAIAASLRFREAGWTGLTRRRYLEWLEDALERGGRRLQLFLSDMHADALRLLTPGERERYEKRWQLALRPKAPKTAADNSAFVHAWTVEELGVRLTRGLAGRDIDRGRQAFSRAGCFTCHRVGDEGGAVGPDLTTVSGRFDAQEVLTSILEPSRVINDQFRGVTLVLLDGRVLTGRIVGLAADSLKLNTDPARPWQETLVDRKQVVDQRPAETSMMPSGLLDRLKSDEILDLLAFLLERPTR